MAAQSKFRAVAGLLLPLVVIVSACNDNGTDPDGGGVLSDVVTAVVIPETGVEATFHTGDAPFPNGGPNVTVVNRTAFIRGGTALVEVRASTEFSRVLLNMADHTGHYVLQLPQPVTETTLAMSLAQVLDEAQFLLGIAAGNDATVGNYAGSMMNILEVGTGDVQINVSWDSFSDVDLHVVDPFGEEIYYGNGVALSGGRLDLDSNAACGVDGINAENVTFQNAPRGTYTVRLDYWHNCGAPQTNWVVTVHVRGQPPRTFSGTFTGGGTQGGLGDGDLITTFTF